MSDEVKVSATLLDISKLHPDVLATVLNEVSRDAKAVQTAVDAIQNDSKMSHEDQKEAVTRLMGKSLNHIRGLYNTDDSEFGKFVHSASHQLVDQVNQDLEADRAPCKTIVFAFLQMIDLGWKLAGAHLEHQQLETLVQ